MANKIQIKRGSSGSINSSTDKLYPGELLYYKDKNYLVVGNEKGVLKQELPITVRELIGYQGDSSTEIGTNKNEAYSIKYEESRGIIIDDVENTLTIPDTLVLFQRSSSGNTVTINTGEIHADIASEPTIEISSMHGGNYLLKIPKKDGTLATTDDITNNFSNLNIENSTGTSSLR